MERILKLMIAGAAALALSAGSAFANTITISGGQGSFDCNDADLGACSAITGGSLTISMNKVTGGTAGSLSNSSADAYMIGSASEENEIAALNVLAGTSFNDTDAVRTNNPVPIGENTWTINTLAAWVILKIGNETLFIQNTVGGMMTLVIEYFANEGEGAGLSHYTEVGLPEIPIPGAIWLMGAGLAGLGFAGRKKKKA